MIKSIGEEDCSINSESCVKVYSKPQHSKHNQSTVSQSTSISDEILPIQISSLCNIIQMKAKMGSDIPANWKVNNPNLGGFRGRRLFFRASSQMNRKLFLFSLPFRYPIFVRNPFLSVYKLFRLTFSRCRGFVDELGQVWRSISALHIFHFVTRLNDVWGSSR